MATIAERLRDALDRKNMKQAELSEITGIGKSSISTYLSGEYEPKQKNIYKMAKDTSPETLISMPPLTTALVVATTRYMGVRSAVKEVTVAPLFTALVTVTST